MSSPSLAADAGGVVAPDPAQIRVLIFGLTARATVQDVQSLLGRCRLASVELLAAPGAGSGAVGVVHLPHSRMLAWQLSEQINRRSLHGHRLHAWVPSMAWA
ncbi:MAG: hypothetical protein AB9M60_19855 [Leptothrix sp. (in: b-proteobacteria)]